MDWKRWLVAANYYSTLPFRCWVNARDARQGVAPIMVLFYHRVADLHPNRWSISRAMFTQQMDWVQQHFDVISLTEAQRRMRGATSYRPAVCVTFDDGYGENAEYALPMLVDRKIPCTYFVSLHHVEHQQPFPHDVQRGRPLRPNTIAELRRFASRGIEIGAHTRHHVDIGTIDDLGTLQDEVVDAGWELAQLVDRPIHHFAFPYGLPANLSIEAIELARESGYAGICSAFGGYNFPGDDEFHLRRIHGDPEMVRFRNWLTVDPRKRAMDRRWVAMAKGLTGQQQEAADVVSV